MTQNLLNKACAASQMNRSGWVRTFAVLLLLVTGQGALWSVETPIDAFKEGKVNLSVRTRYEYGNIDAPDAGNALTARTILGFTTAPYEGFTGKIEFKNVAVANRNGYNYVIGGDNTKTVIADPPTTEVNQAFLQYANEYFKGTVGRKRFILDNARFIGNVGWRQDEQVFEMIDAVVTPVEDLTLTVGYINRVNRIFAEARDFKSESFVFNANYKGIEGMTIGVYDYYLDLSNNGAPPELNTFGAYVDGAFPLEDIKLLYRAEFAFQSVDNAADSNTNYFHGVLGAVVAGFTAKVGYERLGSDDGQQQFLTPLATAHAFNGFADAYLNNGGPNGLQDIYFSVSKKIGNVTVTAIYHYFKPAESPAPGEGGVELKGRADEFDFVVVYPLNKHVKVLAKGAFFNGRDAAAPADRNRFILEATFTY